MKDNELEVTIWNDKGEIVVHEIQECQTATQEQIDEMVMMIERGTPAYIAAFLAQQEQPKELPSAFQD